ncbi:MAG: hypothetical protein KGM24_12270 [Elusimicrobia bacterium]|nr:hypothetical protein [Elusimicrobiota bacterium]
MRATAAAFAALLALLTGCASLPPAPEPTSVDHGVLIVRARVRGAVLPFTSDVPDRATAEQLDDNGEPIPGRTIVSNAKSPEGDAIFVDVAPGRYALTSISFPARGVRYEIAISPADGRSRAVVLPRGGEAFLGSLKMAAIFPEFDVAVNRALDVLGQLLTPWMRHAPIPRDVNLYAYTATPEEEADSLRAAERALAGTQWPPLLRARLRELGAPAVVPREGLLRRELPLNPSPFFSWRDTLRWGPPLAGRNGLLWREPKGSARIAVFFTSATAKGFLGYDEALRELRAAAGSIDDPARDFEVMVGTRAGRAARVTTHDYPRSTLTGSEVVVTVIETVLVPDPAGMYTASLRAERAEFEKIEPAFREFLRQLRLGPPEKKKSPDEGDDADVPL